MAFGGDTFELLAGSQYHDISRVEGCADSRMLCREKISRSHLYFLVTRAHCVFQA